MERKEQTGHICRWMALGIMTAIVIVGCTIVIGLFEWRDRKEIECKNAELHQWRKNVYNPQNETFRHSRTSRLFS